MTDMNETNLSTALPGQERYVAPLEETPLIRHPQAIHSASTCRAAMCTHAWSTVPAPP